MGKHCNMIGHCQGLSVVTKGLYFFDGVRYFTIIEGFYGRQFNIDRSLSLYNNISAWIIHKCTVKYLEKKG